jgi:carbonic anhydrase
MKKIIEGLDKFRSSYVANNRELLDELAHGQKPKVLFITCSDSRIAPTLMTNTDLGDIFVIRNAGNIVPPYGAANGGEGASIEYAIHALGIEQVVICGHSHCGAMKGLLQIGSLAEEMPLVYDWLRHAEATRRTVVDNYPDRSKDELLEIAIAENVLTQIENLKTYPVVRSRLMQGKLQIYGWIYLIETGEVLAYDPMTRAYVAPYTQLPDSERGNDGKYQYTSAPPIACELPISPAQPLDAQQEPSYAAYTASSSSSSVSSSVSSNVSHSFSNSSNGNGSAGNSSAGNGAESNHSNVRSQRIKAKRRVR